MSELGNIKIAQDVIVGIAYKTAEKVAGVYGLQAGVTDKLFGKSPKSGVKVETSEEDGSCKISVYLIVKMGYPISQVASEVQQSVRDAVVSMSGLDVTEVNVYVQDVKEGKEEKEDKDDKSADDAVVVDAESDN